MGLRRGEETVDLVRGDASSAQWTFDLVVRRADDGKLDFAGAEVFGPRDGRHLYLRWIGIARRDVTGFALLAPVFVVVFSAGMWRGLGSLAKKCVGRALGSRRSLLRSAGESSSSVAACSWVVVCS